MTRQWTRIVTLAVVVALVGAIVPTGAQQKPRVAFIPQIVGIPYFNAMEKGGNDAAAKFGVQFIYQGPTTTSPTDQLRIFDSPVQQRVEAISISVLDPTSMPGRRGESHPPAPTEPDVSLSTHPARAMRDYWRVAVSSLGVSL